METIPKVLVGVDVSKDSLDVYIRPLGVFFKIENTKKGHKKLAKKLSIYNVERIACEATGSYEQAFARYLRERSYDVWIIDPRRIKGYNTASGCKTKTDKIDAKQIAEFAAAHAPSYTPVVRSEIQEQLRSLVSHRTDLVRMCADEKVRLKHPAHVRSVRSIKQLIKYLDRRIAEVDRDIADLIRQSQDLSTKSQLLESVPGIGAVTATILLSFVPELGTLGGKQAAALVGLCPYDRTSGQHKGKKFIHGGRKAPRDALYMSAVSAIKHYQPLKKFFDRLIAKNKPFKVAITAVMRKLIVLANTLLKKQELCMKFS